jgi:hypothetical protein
VDIVLLGWCICRYDSRRKGEEEEEEEWEYDEMKLKALAGKATVFKSEYSAHCLCAFRGQFFCYV